MITVQGYAIPWEKPGFALDVETGISRWENCAPNAIAADTPRNITLLVGDHVAEGRRVYAQTKHKSLRFFRDDYGLAFSAYLDDDSAGRAAANAIARGYMSQCSVNLINYHFNDVDGVPRLIWGAIDHVALVCRGAYEDTGCWVADQPLNQMPRHLRNIRESYMDSVLENSRRRKNDGGDLQPHQAARAAAAKPRLPAAVAAMMDSAWWAEFGAKMSADMAGLQKLAKTHSRLHGRALADSSIAKAMLRSHPSA